MKTATMPTTRDVVANQDLTSKEHIDKCNFCAKVFVEIKDKLYCPNDITELKCKTEFSLNRKNYANDGMKLLVDKMLRDVKSDKLRLRCQTVGNNLQDPTRLA